MLAGKFIAIEGIDGVGKSTAVDNIVTWLESRGLDYLVVNGIDGTEYGADIRKILCTKKETGAPLDPITEILLFYAARRQLIEEVIKPAILAGKWVIIDRYYLSTLAYQGFGLNVGLMGTILSLNDLIEVIEPDLHLILVADITTCRARVSKRGQVDRIESRSDEFFNAAQDGFKRMARDKRNCRLINADYPIASVTEEILDAIKYV